MITHEKVKLSTHSICIPLILTIGNLICFCGFLNIMNFDLAELSENLLTFNQVFISANALFMSTACWNSSYILHATNIPHSRQVFMNYS